MSRLGDIRAALVTVVESAQGVNVAEPYPPDKITKNGTVWIDRFSTRIEPGMQRDEHIHGITIACVANRNASLGEAMQATEPVIDTILAALQGDQDLGLGIDYVLAQGYEQVPLTVGGMVYVGFTLRVEATQRLLTEYE